MMWLNRVLIDLANSSVVIAFCIIWRYLSFSSSSVGSASLPSTTLNKPLEISRPKCFIWNCQVIQVPPSFLIGNIIHDVTCPKFPTLDYDWCEFWAPNHLDFSLKKKNDMLRMRAVNNNKFILLIYTLYTMRYATLHNMYHAIWTL